MLWKTRYSVLCCRYLSQMLRADPPRPCWTTPEIFAAFSCTQLASELRLRALCGPQEPAWLACRKYGPDCKEFISLGMRRCGYSCSFMTCRADLKGSFTQSLEESPAKLSPSYPEQLPAHSHAWLPFLSSLSHSSTPSLCCLRFPPHIIYFHLNPFLRVCF